MKKHNIHHETQGTKQSLNPLNLQITYCDVGALAPYKNNPRTHSRRQIKQIAESIEAFGFTNPILLDRANGVVAGHGRLEAAKLLGMKQVPTIQLEHMNDAQKQAYLIADNRLAEKAGWDKNILAIEFNNILDINSSFDLTLTGFEMGEIDVLLQEKDQAQDDDDEIPPAPSEPIAQLGDIWILGDHYILCGDALKSSSYAQLLENEKADLIFTDPPYNVAIQGHVSGLGKVKHEEFAMASGEMSSPEFTTFLTTVLSHMANNSRDGSLHFICMDWRHLQELLTAGSCAYTEFKNICVWNKDRGGMGSLYRSKHEFIFLYKNGKEPHINNVELGKHGRYRSNVWEYPAASGLHRGKNADLALHPTVKPVRMIADAIKDCSNIGNIVLDPFGGSGSTLIAAERTGRKARLIELEPKYVDVTIQRWQALTKGFAMRNHDGERFDDLLKMKKEA